MARIRAANEQIEGITIMAGIEVDILADGALDLSRFGAGADGRGGRQRALGVQPGAAADDRAPAARAGQ